MPSFNCMADCPAESVEEGCCEAVSVGAAVSVGLADSVVAGGLVSALSEGVVSGRRGDRRIPERIYGFGIGAEDSPRRK